MNRVKQISLLLVVLLLGVATMVSASGTVVVTGADVGVSWFNNDTRAGGATNFVAGPTGMPYGIGSLQMPTTDSMGGSSQAKAQLFNYQYGSFGVPGDGVVLADVDGISYWAYRDSASTNSAAQTISLNMEVDYVGDGSSYTTLVFEPIYNGYQGAMLTDTWQYWDAYDGGNAIWWSTRAIPGVCAFNCFVSWNTILANNPNAEVKFAVGFNVGSGWAGDFNGYADGLTFSAAGDATTFDFEPYEVATDKDACKNGGWENLRRADGSSFKNQGDCIQYVNTGK